MTLLFPLRNVFLWLMMCFVITDGFMSHELSSTRYFTDKGILPPLMGLGLALNRTFDSSSSYTDTSYEGSSVPVMYTNDPKSVYRWLSDQLPYQGCIIGFDVESLPKTRRRKGGWSPFDHAATVQLATPDASLVIHLARRSGKHSQACAPIIKAILCDEQFVKAGCALDDDLISLYDLWGGVDAKSRLDLGLLGGRSNRYGLKSLSKGLLGVDLPKPKDIAVSNWSAIPLTEHQIIYSARDAWAGAAIAKKLAEYDPTSFSHEVLVQTLPLMEPTISELADKQRRRDSAKKELRRLLAPYRGKSNHVPDEIHSQVRDLRALIKERINEPHLVFQLQQLLD